MGVFSLRGGQFHRAAPPADLPEETRASVAEALRAQISEFLDFPAFQVAWTRPEGERGTASLVALDATGNIISVDIIDILDGAALLAALARSAQHATLDRREITRLFPGGPHDFSSAWQEFTAVNPPIPEPAPRLSVFAFAIDPDITDAVRALAGAGVQVWQVTILERAAGILLSVDEVRLQRATALGPTAGVPVLDVAPEAEAEAGDHPEAEAMPEGSREGDTAAEAESETEADAQTEPVAEAGDHPEAEPAAGAEAVEAVETESAAEAEHSPETPEAPEAAERPRRRRGSRAAQPGTESAARSRNIWQEIRGRRAAHASAAAATSVPSSAAGPAHTAAHRAANSAPPEGAYRSDHQADDQAAPRRRARRAAE
ncbi:MULTISPECIES: hypothetical protein [Actinotignum]|uniref:hypothetical protein n=1 Tax=Actinotignum TaxID=1653174 RepID=UPI002551BDFF|nr:MULTISPECIES: hypothetical protein [Actinotignum]MDE1537053.1 hypothetical protein [Actinotignum schaalii]MDK6629108.1 hypothetical protein [Actinotignum timonense]MDK7272215.1 hypothetical protein [Actinotignum schaalii]MDY5144527.1 hypothetical protein [Actinotignum timonense]